MASSPEKRKVGQEDAGGEAAKRPRLHEGPDANGATARKPNAAEVLERAKKALAMKKALEERLKKARKAKEGAASTGVEATGAATGAAAGAAVAATPAATPATTPEAGTTAGGRAAAAAVAEVEAAGRASSRAPVAAGAAQEPLEHGKGALAAPSEPASSGRFFDAELAGPGGSAPPGSRRRRAGALRFLEPGGLSRQAEAARRRGELTREDAEGMEARKEAEAAMASDGVNPNLVPLGERVARVTAPLAPPVRPPPQVEWWDARLLLHKGGYEKNLGGGGAGFGTIPGVDGASGSGSGADAAGSPAAEGGQFRPLDGGGPRYSLRPGRVTDLIEHPVPIPPPGESDEPVAPAPLRLTPKELKKLRTQRRRAREEEKQDLIRQGVLEPPAPRVRLANLARVLGDVAAADPTAVEREVRRQMAERAQAHEDRNQARKLTPMEAKEKKARKLLGLGANELAALAARERGDGDEDGEGGEGDAAGGNGGDGGDGGEGVGSRVRLGSAATPAAAPSALPPPTVPSVAVYLTPVVRSRAARYKLRINAQQLALTGVCVAPRSGRFSLVVVEGYAKPQRKYQRLLEHRIDWAAAAVEEPIRDDGGGEADARGSGAAASPPAGVGGATLPSDPAAARPVAARAVWEGEVAQLSFGQFRIEAVADEAAARAVLAAAGVGHYWDLAASSLAGEAL